PRDRRTLEPDPVNTGVGIGARSTQSGVVSGSLTQRGLTMSSISRLLTALLLTASIHFSPPARGERPPALEEIVVTAGFRDSALMDSIGSISVITEQEISARAAQHLQDILNTAPNVSWTAGASRARFVQI